jgi:hypothetical protein
VKRHYVAYRIVRQALDWELQGAENMHDSFGVLLRALQASGISEFIGVEFPDDPTASRMPVPEGMRPQFAEFIRWTFGTEETERVLADSRRLTEWGKILRSPEALRYLRTTVNPSFDRAWIKSGGELESLADSLWAASYRLEESVPIVVEYRENAEVQEAVRKCALYTAQILAHFPELRERFGIVLRDD